MADHEPHKIKTVRLLDFPPLDARKKYLAIAHFNVFNLTPSQVAFDMCSLGTSASSQEQLAGQLSGGNQQKTVLAKWLATDPTVVSTDRLPTSD